MYDERNQYDWFLRDRNLLGSCTRALPGVTRNIPFLDRGMVYIKTN